MSEENERASHKSDRLLSGGERSVCQNIAQSGEGLNKQRAAALLVIDGGLTRAEAGRLSGLTLGQVRYLLATFRQKRLGMFTEEVLMEMESQPQTEDIILESEEEGAKEAKEKVKAEKPSTADETKKGKKKRQTKKKKLKAKGKKMAKKEKKPKKKEMTKEKGKKAKAKGGKKGKGKATKKKAKK